MKALDLTQPKVSCLMVTQCNSARFEFFKKSVGYFCQQTYPNKELIIVADQSSPAERKAYRAHVRSLKRKDIHWVYTKKKLSLGALRNSSVDHARGEIICMWDDDDIYHPQRVQLQYEALKESGLGGVGLAQIFHYFRDSGEVHLFDFSKPKSTFKCCPASIMCYKKVAPRFPHGRPFGEDIEFLRRLQTRTSVGIIETTPCLYVYCTHNSSTTSRLTHLWMLRRLGATMKYLTKNKKHVLNELSHVRLPRGATTFKGKNGEIFKNLRTKPKR